MIIRADRDSFQVTMDAVITLEDVRDQLFMYRGNRAGELSSHGSGRKMI